MSFHLLKKIEVTWPTLKSSTLIHVIAHKKNCWTPQYFSGKRILWNSLKVLIDQIVLCRVVTWNYWWTILRLSKSKSILSKSKSINQKLNLVKGVTNRLPKNKNSCLLIEMIGRASLKSRMIWCLKTILWRLKNHTLLLTSLKKA